MRRKGQNLLLAICFQVFFILSLVFSNLVSSQVIFFESPIIDGKIEQNEWINGDARIITMVDGTTMDISLMYNESHIHVLIQKSDNDPTLIDQSNTWDIFGIEFDNNKDQVPMGRLSSPDDALFISYSQFGGQDFFLQGMGNVAVEDQTHNGTNDVKGYIGLVNGGLVVEATKKLDSGDKSGSDISLQTGDEYYLMFAYWDNKEPYTQSTTHSDWETFRVPNRASGNSGLISDLYDIVPEIIFIGFFILTATQIRFRIYQKRK
ncbi:MAG: hypothetical protein ACW98F_07895 [Candidatus Hodarchaeales archaeon]|jgi:hypothetical protein